MKISYHLESNNTTTNDSHLLGDFLERNGTSASDNLLLINGQTRERCSLRTGGNENVLATDSGFSALCKVDSNGVLVLERTSTLDVLDVVLLEKELNSLCKTGNGGLLCLHHSGEVELDISDLDSAALGVVEDLVVEMRVVEERLGGNAANVQAGSAERATLFDAGDLSIWVSFCVLCKVRGYLANLHACLSGLDSCDITRNTAADDDEVLLLCPTVSRCTESMAQSDATHQLPTHILVVTGSGSKCLMRRMCFG